MEPTAEEFRAALLSIAPLRDYQWRMLRAHYGAARHTLTATQLAIAAGWETHRPVNIHYGKLCVLLAERMGRPAEAHNLALMLESALPGEMSPDLELVLCPALVHALDDLCWSWAGPRHAEPGVTTNPT